MVQRIRFVSLFVCTLRSTGSIRIRNEWKSEQKAEVLLMQRKRGVFFKKPVRAGEVIL